MLRPKQKRAMFTMVLEVEKLLRTLPWVLEPKVMKPARAMVRQARRETAVLMWVTREKRSRVGVLREP
jgi:hypothetical protein